MMYLCDIFRLENNRNALWLEGAADFAAAKARLRILGKGSPGDYLIYTCSTDQKVVFRVGRDDTEPLRIRAYRQGL
jgi:hypothetical protein